MQRTETVSHTNEFWYCDCCGHRTGGGAKCSVCGKDLCSHCGKVMYIEEDWEEYFCPEHSTDEVLARVTNFRDDRNRLYNNYELSKEALCTDYRKWLEEQKNKVIVKNKEL